MTTKYWSFLFTKQHLVRIAGIQKKHKPSRMPVMCTDSTAFHATKRLMMYHQSQCFFVSPHSKSAERIDLVKSIQRDYRLGAVDQLNSDGNKKINSLDEFVELQKNADTYQFRANPSNPFRATLEDGQIRWRSTSPVIALHVAEVVDFTTDKQRKLHINTGTHGDPNGNTVVQRIELGEAEFSKQDLSKAWDLPNVSVHITSQEAKPLSPANIDVVDAWCWSKRSDYNKSKESSKSVEPSYLKSAEQFEKLFQQLITISEKIAIDADGSEVKSVGNPFHAFIGLMPNSLAGSGKNFTQAGRDFTQAGRDINNGVVLIIIFFIIVVFIDSRSRQHHNSLSIDEHPISPEEKKNRVN